MNKDFTYKLRLSEDEMQRIEYLSQRLSINKAEVVRRSITNLYNNIKKEELNMKNNSYIAIFQYKDRKPTTHIWHGDNIVDIISGEWLIGTDEENRRNAIEVVARLNNGETVSYTDAQAKTTYRLATEQDITDYEMALAKEYDELPKGEREALDNSINALIARLS